MSQQFISKYFSPAGSSTKNSKSDGGHVASRASSRGSRPALSLQEEIEISDSDSETLDGGGESGPKDVPASIKDGRKRKRATRGRSQLNPEDLRPPRENTSPQETKVYRGNIGQFQQKKPENNGRRQEEETTSPNPGDIEGKRDSDVHGYGTNKPSMPDSKSPPSKSAPVVKAATTEVMITKESFDLLDNVTRRKEFQASVEAILRDDGPIYSSYDTVKAGDDREGSRGGGGKDEDVKAAATTHMKAFAGGSKGTSSKGKRKAGGASGGVKLTPMEQQVCDLKAKHPGVLLLVECGYRFRFFGEDALAAAKVLRIYAYMDHNFHVASIPSFRLAVHLRRLVDAGYKVGVVRQAESAALKAAGLTESGKKSGTFKRELVAVFTQVCCRSQRVVCLTDV